MEAPGDETLSAFFAAADRLFAKDPWEASHDSQVMAVDAPDFGWPKGACVALVGAKGDHPSLMVFPSLDQYVQFMEQAEEAEITGDPPVAECAVFNVNFDPKREVPKAFVRHAKVLGLRAGDPQGFPWIERFAPRNLALDPEDEDYGFATALMEALSSLLEARPDLFSREELTEPLAAEGTFASAGKRHTVGVAAPHPEAPWRWDESAIDYFRWATVDELSEEYLKATEPEGGRECEDADWLAQSIDEFFAFKVFTQGVDPLDLSHDDVEEYLLRYLPSIREDFEESQVPLVPERLSAFVRWLGEEGRIDPELAAILAADVERCRTDFFARMKAPAEPEAGAPARKWTWTPGDPMPDPKGDCPCGSGKRYKKCCMVR